MAKKIIIYICAVIIFLVPLFLIISSNCSDKMSIRKYKFRNDSLEKAINQYQCQVIDLRDIINTIYTNEGYDITDQYPKVFLQNNKIPLSKLKSHNRMFVRISDMNCWSCVKDISVYLNTYKPQNVDVVYLLTSQSSIVANELVKYAKLKNSVCLLCDSLKIPIEKYGEPYFFYIDSDNHIRRLLMPIKGEHRLIDLYLRTFKN